MLTVWMDGVGVKVEDVTSFFLGRFRVGEKVES